MNTAVSNREECATISGRQLSLTGVLHRYCRGILFRASAVCRIWLACGTGLIGAAGVSADIFRPEERFAGMLSSGEYVHADRVHDWHGPDSRPRVAGRELFDAKTPFRWLIDQAVSLAPPPAALVEFYGGDTLPCRVVGYEPAVYDSFRANGEHLVVEPSIPVDPPGSVRAPFLRIRTRWLKRVVFERKAGVPAEWHPGTAWLHDGSTVRFRAVRWGKGAVAVLTDDGVKTLLHSQVAELHLPKRSGWDQWFEQLAVLSPDLTSRLLQIECEHGLRLTASTSRYRPGFTGDQSKPENWYPLFHPAWSLDPLVIPFGTVRIWRFFSPLELPATLLEPAASREGVVFSSGWNWVRHRGVQRTTPISGGRHVGWGFGTHAPTRLTLPLHEVVTAFRTRVGLDQVAGTGGCARAEVAAGPKAAVLWRSDTLIGSSRVLDSGWKNLPDPGDAELLLTADPLIDERPGGADPYDIRDCVNWIEPELRLDRKKLLREVSRRRLENLPALHDWELTHVLPIRPGMVDDAGSDSQTAETPADIIHTASAWDDRDPADGRFVPVMSTAGRFVAFTRELKIGEEHRWLGLAIDQPVLKSLPAEDRHVINAIVRLDGRTVLLDQLPQRSGQAIPDPLLVPVDSLQNALVRCDVILFCPQELSSDGNQAVSAVDPARCFAWHGAELTDKPPGIAVVFDEDRSFAEALSDGEGRLDMTTSDVSSGKIAMSIAGGERSNPLIDGLELPLREYPRPGEFRYLRFAWKKADGDLVALSIGHDGQLGLPELAIHAPRPQAFRPGAARRAFLKRREPRRVIRSDDRGARYAYRYDSGSLQTEQPVLRLDRRLPSDWKVHTRDLFAEFGAFTLTGIGLESTGGGPALFDQIYLARTQADFQWIPELSGVQSQAEADGSVIVAPDRPARYGPVVSRVAPQFAVGPVNESVALLSEFSGRKNILRTHPNSQELPTVFYAPLTVAGGGKTELRLAVTHHPEADWELQVRAAGRELLKQTVSEKTVQEGWLDVSVDLSSFAGRNVIVQVIHQATGWQNEYAYWSRLEITQP